MVRAFGETICGVPYYVVVPLICATLFAPLVYVMAQAMVLMTSRWRTSVGLYSAREVRKAWIVVIVGGIYFAVLFSLWGAYTAILGI